MEFVPFGGTDKIKLTVNIVQNLVAVPTRSGKTCSERDALKFMALCQAQRLNPFAGDAFLIGYDSQTGPTFSLITAHQAFLKRAETSPDYEGMESGIVILKGDSETVDREGDFHLPDETVVGGWAKVHRKGRTPTYRRLRMARFNKGFAQWKEDPAGMICKCAEADALRSTFPTLLGGLYHGGEIIDISSSAAPAEMPSRLAELAPPPASRAEDIQGEGQNDSAPSRPVEATPQTQLGDAVVNAGFTVDHFISWARGSGQIPEPQVLDSFDDVTLATAKRLLRVLPMVLKGCGEAKGAA